MKKRKRGILGRIKIFHIILLILVVYMASGIVKQRSTLKELSKRKDELEGSISGLEKDITSLEKEIANSDSLEFIEKVAREELGMVKPREIIYIDKDKGENSKLNTGNR